MLKHNGPVTLTTGEPRAYLLAEDPGIRVSLASLGLACCAMEVESAVRLGLLVAAGEAEPADASVLLVAGTVTEPLVPVVQRALDSCPPGTLVVSFGACAATGGPYWDAPTVVNGVDGILPVATYIPGCPPRPDALVAGLRALVDARVGDPR